MVPWLLSILPSHCTSQHMRFPHFSRSYPKASRYIASFMNLALSSLPRWPHAAIHLSWLALHTFLLILCSWEITMVSYRRNKVFSYCSILLGFHYLQPEQRYHSPHHMLALVAFSRLYFLIPLPYSGSYHVIMLLLSQFAIITVSWLLS